MNTDNQNLNDDSSSHNEIVNLDKASTSAISLIEPIEPLSSIFFSGPIKTKEKISILNLPNQWYYVLFGKFLVMSDIIAFESALRTKQQRKSFAEKIKNFIIFVDTEITGKMTQRQMMNWIMQRGVRFNSLPIRQWNAVYLSADILNYFINQETNNHMEKLIIYIYKTNNQSVEEQFSPMSFKIYCESLVELKTMSFVGRFPQKYLQSIELDSFDPLLQMIVQSCYKLEEIRLVNCSVSLFSLNSIAEFCTNLKVLRIQAAKFAGFHTDCFKIDSFSNIVKLLQLIEIDLSFSAVAGPVVTFILRNCMNLEKIILFKIYKSEGFSIRESNFQNCFANVNNEKLKLSVINITHNDFDSDDVCVLLKKTPNLTIYLATNTNFTDKVSTALSENCTNLTTLNVAVSKFDFTENAFIKITESCVKLKYININKCRGINDNCLNAICINCIDLETLFITKCINVGDQGVVQILNNCTKLKEIVLNSCLRVTNEMFTNINRNFTELKKISFQNCTLVTEVGIFALIAKCPKNMIYIRCDQNILTEMVVEEMKKKFDVRDIEEIIN